MTDPKQHVTYIAPILVALLAAMFAWRQFMEWLEAKYYGDYVRRAAQKKWVDVAFAMFHYYVALYAICAYISWDELQSSLKLLMNTDFLAPETIRAAFDDETVLPPWWEKELWNMLGEGSSALRWFSLTSPVFLILTFIVSFCNTARHVWAMLKKGGGFAMNPGIDSTIMIIALPLIACMMAYRSVTRMWVIAANDQSGGLQSVEDLDGHRTWEARLVLCQNMYKTNSLISDLYESWALLHFANLCLQVINAVQQKRTFGLQQNNVDKKRYTEGLSSLVNQGIYLFNFTCAIEAIYYLTTTGIEIYIPESSLWLTKLVNQHKEQAEYLSLGMGAIASTAAIGNVVTVELTFHHLLEEFTPEVKFWSTKILVSIAFIQSLLLYVPPLDSLSVTEQDLFYNAALCLECFLVSLLHVKAWVPNEEWYDDLRKFEPSFQEPSGHIAQRFLTEESLEEGG